MFRRKQKKSRPVIVHTPECEAIHRAMLMSLYLGYGAPSAPLFIPTGSLVCTCDDAGRGTSEESTPLAVAGEQKTLRVLVTA
jgi:hypothetical protein